MATEPAKNDVLLAEGQALAQCRNPHIIRLTHPEMLRVHGHVGLLLQLAEETLGDFLRRVSRPSLDMQERFGRNLLEALHHLEMKGILHRDIKPENIGIVQNSGTGHKQLLLFDFSLHNQPLESLKIGTRAYRDPFLPDRGRWDSGADRFSAAVTLYEMVTGRSIGFGDEGEDPLFSKDPANVESDLFESALQEGLTVFFRRAFAVDAADRFDTADDMHRAWVTAHDKLTESAHTPHDQIDLALEACHRDDDLHRLNLPVAIRPILERQGLSSIRDVLDLNMAHMQALPGVTQDTRILLNRVLRLIRHHFRKARLPGAQPQSLSIDEFYERLYAKNEQDNRLIHELLELCNMPKDGKALILHAAGTCDVDYHRVQTALKRALKRWGESKHEIFAILMDTMRHILQREGGLLSLENLAERLWRRYGFSPVTKPNLAIACAVARAGFFYAAQQRNYASYWQTRPIYRALAIGLDPDGGLQGRFDMLFSLVTHFDELVEREPLTHKADLDALLAEQPLTPIDSDIQNLDPARAAQLVVQFTRRARLSSRGDLYPAAMPTRQALHHGRSALLGLHHASIQEVKERIRNRFPEADILPDHPELDRMLERAGLNLVWHVEAGEYQARPAPTSSYAGTHSMAGLTESEQLSLEKRLDLVRKFEARLNHSLKHGGLLFLRVAPRAYAETVTRLRREWACQTVDGDDWILKAMRREAETLRIPWQLVPAADAEPGAGEWHLLLKLVGLCRPHFEHPPGTGPAPSLLTHAGLLARYDLMDLFDRWRDQLARRTLWVLVAGQGQNQAPALDGRLLPILTPNDHWWIPHGWATAEDLAP